MRLASPLYLLLLLPLAALVWLELRKKTGAIRFSDTSFFRSIPHRGKYLNYIPLALNVLVLCLVVLALARPQQGRVFEETETKGVDIMLCLDVSETMSYEDFSPKNRLFVARERAKEFIRHRHGAGQRRRPPQGFQGPQQIGDPADRRAEQHRGDRSHHGRQGGPELRHQGLLYRGRVQGADHRAGE